MPPPSTPTTGGPGREFARLTAINIAANLTVPLASLVDTALLGRLAEIRFLAGVALAGVIFDYLYWSFGFLRMATTGTTAQALGRDDREEVYLTLYRSLVFAWLLSALLLLLQRPLATVGFALLSPESGVEAAGRSYFFARIWAAPATLSNFALLGWFLGLQQSRNALWMTVTANAANVVLDYLLIVRMGWAALGAGIATAVSQYLMLGVGVALFLAQPGRRAWRWRQVVEADSARALLRLNREILWRTLVLITTFALFFKASALLGTAVLAANTILHRLQSLAAYLIDGAAYAVESLAGLLAGARRDVALRRLLRLALLSGVGLALLVALPAAVAPRRLLGLFTTHASVLRLAVDHSLWLLPVLLAGAAAFVYDGLFLGLTRGRALRNAMLASSLIGFLPLALAAVLRGSNHLLWLAMAVFMLARAVLLASSDRCG